MQLNDYYIFIWYFNYIHLENVLEEINQIRDIFFSKNYIKANVFKELNIDNILKINPIIFRKL